MRSIHARLAAFILIALCCLPAGAIGAEVHPWDVVEIALTAERQMENAYVEGLPEGGGGYVTVTFRGENGPAEGQQCVLTGFWDGERTWRVRFAPPAAGKWTYRSRSADAGLDGKTGEVECVAWTDDEKAANPTRRGFVRVAASGPRPGRYFEYADGTPMLWLGDTWWNWTKRGIHMETFQKLADDRAEKGFNVGQLFFAGSGWGRDASLLDRTFTEPDLEQIRRVEEMIRYANQRGITVWVHGWWSREDTKERIGAENMRRWCRYMVHRLGAYNVIWVLAGEYNMHNYGGMGLDFWKDLGRMIDEEDPYERIIGVHPTPPGWSGGDAAPQWSTAEVLHNEPWLDYNQSQVGHGRWRNDLIPWVINSAYARQPAKPIVVTEPWYEFIEGNPPAADVRFGGWSAILAGAAGHSYGGGHVWRGHVPESPAGRGTWPLEEGFETDTLDYPGARSLSYMARFLREIDWWLLEPHVEPAQENAACYCGAAPGREYVVYLRYGGAVKVDLRPSKPEDQFAYRWIDLVEEKVKRTGKVSGGAVSRFHPPEDYPSAEQYKDWVLHVVRREM